jgi:hypothetical protein
MRGSEHWVDEKVLVYRTYTRRMADRSEDRSLFSPRPNSAPQLHMPVVNLNLYVVGLTFGPALKRFFDGLSHIFCSDHFRFNLNDVIMVQLNESRWKQ